MRLRLPSPFFLLAATVAAAFGILTATRGLIDADYYWHVTAGRLVTEQGVLRTDPFSFTWGGRPWVMHEWLGEVLMYQLVNLAGVGIATFIFGVIAIGGPLVVAWTLSRRGVPMVAVVVVTALVAFIYTSYATIRPQALSWLLLGALLAGLITLRPEHRWRPWLVVPLFALWANVHGLYVIGLGVLALYVLFTLLGRTPMSQRRWEMLLVLIAAFGASALTPAGPSGLLYPLRYVEAGDWGLLHIAEWQSPNFHDLANVGLLLLIVAVMANGGRATPGWLTAVALIGLVGGLLATRNVPLAALLAMPTLMLGLGDRLPVRADEGTPSEKRARRLMEIGLAAVVVIATALIVPRLPAVSGDDVVPRTFPVAATDELEALQPDARVFAEYHWGGYVTHRLYDSGGRVFVDGRNDMYDQQVLADFVAIRNADDGWQDILGRYGGADAIILPPGAALVAGPAEQTGWCEVHRDPVAVLLLSQCP